MRPTSATAARPSPAPAFAPAPAPIAPSPRAITTARTSTTATHAGATRGPARAPGTNSAAPPGEQKILFQKFFKSVGPRTYAAQVKEANNGNHFLVVTEGKRDDATGEVRKTRLFVFSEDFNEFFDLLEQAARFIKAHPVPAEVEQRRQRFWAKKNAKRDVPPSAAAST